jgi:hypothetical protein
MRILLHETEIDSLIDRGFLKGERRCDQDAVQDAIDDFICQDAIDDFICHVLAPDEKEM